MGRLSFKILISLLFILVLSKSGRTQDKRPNIILIMADDLGFSDIGSYGGEVQTPNLDLLAKQGIRYKQFYNAARCCPTRASLMTGLYPHQAGMGWMAAADLGTPAYQGNLNNNSVTIAEVLKTAGYGTYMTGKWHLTNERKIKGMVTDNWPKQRGFERYFGIIPGGSNYFTPVIYSDNNRYKAPENFYLTDAISDTTVKFIGQHFTQNPNKPMFMYVAYTAPHWPLHALQKDIDKYKDVYKAGWDVIRKNRFEKQKKIGLFSSSTILSPRDKLLKGWDSLSEERKAEMEMRMAIYAAQIDNMDQGIGRIIAKLKAEDQLENTLIFFLSDNGACAEFISSGKSKLVNAKEDTFESYRLDWANVSSTPYREYKHFTNEGGIATPLIVQWPKGIEKKLNNSFVKGYGHLTDIMATCVEVGTAKYPSVYNGNKIHTMVGKSLVPHFSAKDNDRGRIFWEHEANIAVRDGKWKLVAKTPENAKLDIQSLKLYDMDTDPTEMNNLSEKYPDRVKDMYTKWEDWGKEINVFPLDTREYNVRADAYQRQINGNFDDNLGGWNIHKSSVVKANVTIDTLAKLMGKKSLHVRIKTQGNKPADLLTSWNFKAKKGEKFKVKLKTLANNNSNIILRLENADPTTGFEKMLNEELSVSDKIAQHTFQSITLPKDGNYKLSLYMGTLKVSDEVWVDDVELILL